MERHVSGPGDSLRQRTSRLLSEARRALLGVSTYEAPKGYGPDLDDDEVEAIRRALGGQLQPIPTTKLRWYLADLERAQANADAGNLLLAAQLWRAMRRDGVISGLIETRTSGLIRLDKKWEGPREVVEDLTSRDGARSVFDDMCPPSELAALHGDGIALGVGIAELCPVEGRDYPVLVRLDPQYLQYRWQENRWYFASVAGLLPITPGDGRWVLHITGGRLAPWTSGKWPAMGRSFINKEHALLARSNYSAKLANPARAAVAPPAATEQTRKNMIAALIRWGLNSVFELPVGWDVKLIESNGRGYDVFQQEIKTSDEENMITLAGQLVTTTGGAGFSNSDVQRLIRSDLIEGDAETLAYTVNTQILPPYIAAHHGPEALAFATGLKWRTDVPKDLRAGADAMQVLGQAITALREALGPFEITPKVENLLERFNVPFRKLKPAEVAELKARANPPTQGDPEALKEAA